MMTLALAAVMNVATSAVAQVETLLRPLHVEGRHLVDDEGTCTMLRGVMYGPHPFFNNGAWGSGWDDATVARCLDYFDKVFEGLTDTTQGSFVNMWRVPWEEYWCVTPNVSHTGTDTSTWDEAMALKYLDKLFVPLIENAVSKGLYVVLRPTYGNPGTIQVGDDYQAHLVHEWEILSSHPRLKALSGYLSFELLNEPTVILDRDGNETEGALADYMQPMVDMIRSQGFDGIIWSSGLAFQSKFRDELVNPVVDDNLGYAVHIYPGWFSQDDATADGERLLSAFNYDVPVVKTHPIVITEVDWSPEKEGEGRIDEFGKWIPSNWGTWGTGSTSKWGNAFKYMLEQNKNVSVAIGSADEYFDIPQYIKDGTFVVGFDGNPECSSQMAYEWYDDWAHRPAETPAQRDRTEEQLLGKVQLTSVEELTENLFEMVQGTSSMLYIKTADVGGWDMMYGTASTVVNAQQNAYLFKAHPVEVDGKTYYALKCYNEDGTLRLSGLDGGNGDGVNITSGSNNVLFLGSTRANGPKAYGQDLDYGGLWDIQKRATGFTFRSVSENNKYLGTASSPQSTSAVTWKCYSRYGFWKNRDIPYQRRNDETGMLHTFCVPYDATVENADVYEFSGVDDAERPTSVWFNAVPDGQTRAGEAYLLRATTDGDILATMSASSVVSRPKTTSAFTGVFQPTALSEGTYMLNDGEWLCVGSENDILLPAYRAMLDLSRATTTTGGDLSLPLQQISTGVSAVTSLSADNTCYTLSGIPVGKPSAWGLYIQGGRKFFVQ